MSKRLNIPSTIEDPAYRYTMPEMKLKQESRLNGVKTNITNLPDVAHALRVPESSIIKYFCSEVGANQEQTSIVKGDHKYSDLLRLLDKFIIKYVLCGNCKYPECAFEVQKKDLLSTCNACGYSKKLDTLHKAGKQLFKEVPTFYANNPEFKGKQNKNADVMGALADADKKKKKKSKKSSKKAEEEAKVEEEKKVKKRKERAKKTLEEGGEVNVLDAQQLALDSPEIEQLVQNVNTLIKNTDPSINDLLEEVRNLQVGMNVTPDYKFYILFMGVFNPERNIVKNWAKYEMAFLKLVKETGEKGIKRLWQTIVLFFIVKYPDQQKYLSNFLKLMYDQSVFSDEFIIGWHEAKTKMDKGCCLYDRKSEKKMRALCEEFVEWLQSGEYGEEEYDEEEGDAEEFKIEEDAPKKEESEAARKQRELVEAQQKAQAEALAAKKVQSEQQAAKQEEEEKVEEVKETTDIAKIEVEDDFDIDDI